MSQPNIPNITPDITLEREDAINLLLASIAFEELGLSHILNAEGEKIQYAVGTLPGLSVPATIDELVKVNSSVSKTLKNTVFKEMVLHDKLNSILKKVGVVSGPIGPIGATGPTGPAGPPGPAGSIGPEEVELVFNVRDLFSTTTFSSSSEMNDNKYQVAPSLSSKESSLRGYFLPLDSSVSSVGTEFKMPTNYPSGNPICVEAHILIPGISGNPSGNLQLRLRADFRSDCEEWGPTTAYKRTVLSPIRFVCAPTSCNDNRCARHFRFNMQLDGLEGLAHSKDWTILQFDRPTIMGGFPEDSVLLSVVSIRYSTTSLTELLCTQPTNTCCPPAVVLPPPCRPCLPCSDE